MMKISRTPDNTTAHEVELDFVGLTDFIKHNDYSLGVFKDGHRKASNFIKAEAIGLDFDGGLSLKDAYDLFWDYKHIIATTKSHQKEKNGTVDDRFRVILFLEEPITDKDVYKATVKDLIEKFPQADPACTDASRFWYKSLTVDQTNGGGKLIKPSDYKKLELVSRVELIIKGRLSEQTYRFLTFGAPEGQWNSTLYKAAKDIQEQNYNDAEARELLINAARAKSGKDGELDDKDLKTIESAFSNDPKHEPRLPEKPAIDARPISQLLIEKPQIDWVIDGLLTRGGFSLWVGQPKSGKSTIVRQAAVDIAQGNFFLNRKVKQGSSLYLALEEQDAVLYQQFKKLGAKESDDILLHTGGILSSNPLDSLNDFLNKNPRDFVVIDTLLLFSNFDANNYNQVNQTLSQIRTLAREAKCHIACIHHQNKSRNVSGQQMQGAESILGSNAIHAAVDCAIILNKMGRKRKISSSQRGGKPFTGQVLAYEETKERYFVWEEKDEF